MNDTILNNMKHTTKTAEGHLQKELPDTIYLQLHGCNEYVGNNEEIDFGDVTWSEDRIYPTDVEYAKVKSPWISVKDKAGCDSSNDCIVMVKNGDVFIAYFSSKDKWIKKDGGSYDEVIDDVIAWMPFPSFDEILEANKYVLERIKEKGD